MKEIDPAALPNGSWPYVAHRAANPTWAKPTAPQQKILDMMREGAWYKPDNVGPDGKLVYRTSSVHALFRAGWLVEARMARRDAKGRLHEASPEMLLAEILLGKGINQPMSMFRKFLASPEGVQRP